MSKCPLCADEGSFRDDNPHYSEWICYNDNCPVIIFKGDSTWKTVVN